MEPLTQDLCDRIEDRDAQAEGAMLKIHRRTRQGPQAARVTERIQNGIELRIERGRFQEALQIRVRARAGDTQRLHDLGTQTREVFLAQDNC